jgi:4-diphosphocytidyl-2-C-methyl-D-erythritol kinase
VLSTRAPGKVNLCLLVGAPRADGLHPIVSLFQHVRIADELSLGPAAEVAGGDDIVVCPGVSGPNLAARALAEFRAATGWDAPPQQLTIEKRIPIAAGMAGGSSDAAAALRLAAAASGLAIPPELPMRLGADVPAMLAGARTLVTGAGETVEPLGGDAPALIILPIDAALSAGEVYTAFDRLGPPRSEEELSAAAERIRAGDIGYVNDLEPAARALCPQIDPALDALREAGVTHPMVTGSGPTVFGLGHDPEALERLHAAGYPRAVAA